MPKCEQCGADGKHYCRPRAERVVNVFAQILVHTKGEWSRKPFVLSKWQREEIIKPLFGTVEYSREWKRYVRQYRTAWLELARKNGKTELMAGLGLILLAADGEEGSEVYAVACDRDQARKTFDVSKRMVELSPLLSKHLRVYRNYHRIIHPQRGSFFEAVASDSLGNLGHNPHGVLFDEVLTQPNRELWDAFATAMGARAQPLMIAATTAGDDTSGICSVEHEYTEKVLANPRLDPRRFGYIRNTPEDADIFDPKTWRIANPALGTFKSRQFMLDEARKAKSNPASAKAFRQFQLNQWGTASVVQWITLEQWDATAGLVTPETLRGLPVYGGLDLASSVDVAAWCVCAKLDDSNKYAALWRFWAPEAQRGNLDDRTAGQATVWARQGFMRFTEGDVIDYKAIVQDIDFDAQRFDIQEVAYDRWGMTQLSQTLTDQGLTVTPVGQGFATMSPASKQWEGLIRAKRFLHGGNPVMRWMIQNVRLRTDPSGNIKPDKGKSMDKIDGVVAALMATDRALRNDVAPVESVYETRGMLSV